MNGALSYWDVANGASSAGFVSLVQMLHNVKIEVTFWTNNKLAIFLLKIIFYLQKWILVVTIAQSFTRKARNFSKHVQDIEELIKIFER